MSPFQEIVQAAIAGDCLDKLKNFHHTLSPVELYRGISVTPVTYLVHIGLFESALRLVEAGAEPRELLFGVIDTGCHERLGDLLDRFGILQYEEYAVRAALCGRVDICVELYERECADGETIMRTILERLVLKDDVNILDEFTCNEAIQKELNANDVLDVCEGAGNLKLAKRWLRRQPRLYFNGGMDEARLNFIVRALESSQVIQSINFNCVGLRVEQVPLLTNLLKSNYRITDLRVYEGLLSPWNFLHSEAKGAIEKLLEINVACQKAYPAYDAYNQSDSNEMKNWIETNVRLQNALAFSWAKAHLDIDETASVMKALALLKPLCDNEDYRDVARRIYIRTVFRIIRKDFLENSDRLKIRQFSFMLDHGYSATCFDDTQENYERYVDLNLALVYRVQRRMQDANLSQNIEGALECLKASLFKAVLRLANKLGDKALQDLYTHICPHHNLGATAPQKSKPTRAQSDCVALNPSEESPPRSEDKASSICSREKLAIKRPRRLKKMVRVRKKHAGGSVSKGHAFFESVTGESAKASPSKLARDNALVVSSK